MTMVFMQATTLVTLRELLEMYGIAAAAACFAEKAEDRGVRNLLGRQPEFVEV